MAGVKVRRFSFWISQGSVTTQLMQSRGKFHWKSVSERIWEISLCIAEVTTKSRESFFLRHSLHVAVGFRFMIVQCLQCSLRLFNLLLLRFVFIYSVSVVLRSDVNHYASSIWMISHIVGRDVVLCEVNWWRFVTLFKQNWISRFKGKLSASARLV